MKKKYDEEFHKEIERILNQIYNEPLDANGPTRSAIIESKTHYVEFLKINNLVYLHEPSIHNYFPLTLDIKGIEVFEKYNGWFDYKKKVIDKQKKIENAKSLAQEYWWAPVIISLVALIASIFSLFLNA